MTTYEKPRRFLLGGGIEPGGSSDPTGLRGDSPGADVSRLTTWVWVPRLPCCKGLAEGHIYSWDDGPGHAWAGASRSETVSWTDPTWSRTRHVHYHIVPGIKGHWLSGANPPSI